MHRPPASPCTFPPRTPCTCHRWAPCTRRCTRSLRWRLLLHSRAYRCTHPRDDTDRRVNDARVSKSRFMYMQVYLSPNVHAGVCICVRYARNTYTHTRIYMIHMHAYHISCIRMRIEYTCAHTDTHICNPYVWR